MTQEEKLPASLAVVPNIHPRDQTDEQLKEEAEYWASKIRNATSWRASLAVASKFLENCEREIERRKK
jgi:hypothetical protein